MEQLWERSREGRKETNRKLSTGTGKEGVRDQAGENGENRGSESGRGALRKPLWGGDRKRRERKEQRPSSEALTRKRTRGSGSQASAPEERSERGSPVEQLRERSRAGRKETIRKPSTGTGKERMRNQAGKSGEAQEAKAEREHRRSHCEAETGRSERKKQRAE